ncbi:hypothetical protein AMTR_s00037p00123670, partial [Amborella trichopoda]
IFELGMELGRSPSRSSCRIITITIGKRSFIGIPLAPTPNNSKAFPMLFGDAFSAVVIAFVPPSILKNFLARRPGGALRHVEALSNPLREVGYPRWGPCRCLFKWPRHCLGAKCLPLSSLMALQ